MNKSEIKTHYNFFNEIVTLPDKFLRTHFCGAQLGKGSSRIVFELKDYPSFVIKIEHAKFAFANVTEWCNYHYFKDYKAIGKYLAPCISISENGRFMVMLKVEHKPVKEYPKRLPYMFSDTKRNNYGFINGEFVCCDYSFLILGYDASKMRTVKWRNK